MPQSLKALRIVVPAHNEASRIEATLRDYCSTFAGRATIVVVANGCDDDTAGVVRRLRSSFSNLECLEIHARIGKGGAVRAGFSTAVEEFLAFVDADGSTSAAEFDRLFAILAASDADALIGSRWLKGSRVEPRQSLVRRVASRSFNGVVRVTLGLHFSDTQCGAKIFRRSALQPIWSALEIADFSFDIEVLALLQRAGRRIIEVPTVWRDRAEGTKVRLVGTSWKMLRSVIRLRLRSSALWRVPFVDYFARDTTMPVKPCHRMLLLGATLHDAFEDPSLGPFLAHLQGRGVVLVDTAGELDLGSAVGMGSRLRFLSWYLFGSKRDYDAIVEVRGHRAWWLPAFSAKPAFVVSNPRRFLPDSRAYDKWYKRCVRVDVEPHTAESAADEILAATLGRIPYAAVFVADSSGFAIHSRPQPERDEEKIVR